MRPLLFPGDQQFWYETQRALSHTAYGGADIGEVVTTAARITAGDYDSWYDQWAATAQRTEAEARGQLAAGHQVSARDGLLRAATYFRSAEFFTRDRDPDPRGRPAYDPTARSAPIACSALGCSTGSTKPRPDPRPGPHPAGHNHPATRVSERSDRLEPQMFSGRRRFPLQLDTAIITQHAGYSTVTAGFLKARPC